MARILADESEPHNSLARIAIDLPPDYDSVFGLNVQKSNVIVPPNFESVFRSKLSVACILSRSNSKASRRNILIGRRK